MPEHIFKMAPNRQPPYQHSYHLDTDSCRLFAEGPSLWIPSYGRSNINFDARIPDTEDFEIDWPILDKYADDLDTELYQTTVPQASYNNLKRTAHYNKPHRSIHSAQRIESRPFLNTTSKQALLPRPNANARSYSAPIPLVLSMSAFKRDNLRVPPAPPPSPTLTSPPSPPFCPLYEEYQTLGVFDIPAISIPRPAIRAAVPRSPEFVTYCSSDSTSTDVEEDERDFGTDTSSCYLVETLDDYDSAPPPPSIQLYRTTSQPGNSLQIPRHIMSTTTLCPSRSSPPTPSVEKSLGKSLLASSFFEWDPEPELPAPTQWGRFKHSRYRNSRRGSDSDESHSSKSSVREKAERLRRKLEGVFGKR
ncbi:hypothetical protein TWF106_003209 [Orbilia oligospora]|uniref:Uncharacterized protein n=1 Tax=Orbilia oligospora TaxID=2813651 RepID=A0A7C8UHL6_ORBOL|nr:hypothetical protein TWF106_003209 [Orbilia oligospora]